MDLSAILGHNCGYDKVIYHCPQKLKCLKQSKKNGEESVELACCASLLTAACAVWTVNCPETTAHQLQSLVSLQRNYNNHLNFGGSDMRLYRV